MSKRQFVYSNSSTRIEKSGDVYILEMIKGENRFNPNFMDDLNLSLNFVEKSVN